MLVIFACYIVVFEGGVQGCLRDLHTVPGRFFDDGRGQIWWICFGWDNGSAVRVLYHVCVAMFYNSRGGMRFRGVLCW